MHVIDNESSEQKYCVCQEGEHGKMVKCDNENCSMQWFHFQCVSLTDDPVGQWFCPFCDN